ncbi:hypothetical protein BDQ17DRAFT_1436061 [Cyathus striatus]|nr:hypothetical protein BDQ17DRAFT_1436061 [Cyathus striatus]
MIGIIRNVPYIEKLAPRMPATSSPTKVLQHLSQEKNPNMLPLLKELRIEIVNGFSLLVKNYLVEEVLKSRSNGVHESVEGSPSSGLNESVAGFTLSMEVPQSYYEEYTSPDTKLCMDDIKALADELSMEIDFDLRVAEIGEDVTDIEDQDEEVEQESKMVEKIRYVSDDEDDGIWS